jgi:iron complex transport system ATP-binding protein
MALLSARSCDVERGGQAVVKGVNFDLEAGTCTALLGPNGSGKTTLLRAAGGTLPYSGRLDFDGTPVRNWPAQARARRVAFVRQAPAVSFDLRVEDVVALGRAPHKRLLDGRSAADRDRVARALDAVELGGFEARSVRALSGGERQRVFLAQALVQNADLLLLDEPTAHLDVHYQYAFLERVRRLCRADGRTVLAALHDLEQAARFADHVLVLHDDGRLAAAGPPAEVLTPALLAEVFRMDARVDPPDRNDPLRIRYLGPTQEVVRDS